MKFALAAVEPMRKNDARFTPLGWPGIVRM